MVNSKWLKKEFGSLGHHAYCIVGNDSVSNTLIEIFDNEIKGGVKGNPDILCKEYDTFTIDQARAIKALAETRPVSDFGKKIYILTINNITVEAQNALLKLLEEPTGSSHFFLIIPSLSILLPTVISRLKIIAWDKDNDHEELLKEAKSFLSKDMAGRMKYIGNLLTDLDKEKINKRQISKFLDSIETYIYKNVGVEKGKKTLESIAFVKKYIEDRSASMKMLLEYIALFVKI